MKLYTFQTVHLPIIRSLFTVYSTMVYVILKFHKRVRITSVYNVKFQYDIYRGADKSLARPTFRCILFYGQNISFDANLVIYTNCTNIPPIMIINRIYEHQNLLSL
jgi:hypothetical protein